MLTIRYVLSATGANARSEHEARAKLNAARLIYVEAKRRDAEVPERIGRIVKVDVIEIDARHAVAAAVEQIEELSAKLEVCGLVDARLLQDAQVFVVEGLRAQVVISRRGVAEETQRIGSAVPSVSVCC